MTSATPQGMKSEWPRHWPVVLAAFLGIIVSQLHLYTIGVLIIPLEREFQWSRVEISSGTLIISLIVCPLSPVLGYFVDRFGPKRIALLGVLVYGTAFACFSLVQQAIWTWWIVWVILGVGQLLLNPTVWIAGISSLFNAGRGLALAVALSASGFAAGAAPIFTYFLERNFGWRITCVIWAALVIAVVLPMIYFFFTSAHDARRKEKWHGQIAAPSIVKKGASIAACLRSPGFLKLAVASFVIPIATMSLAPNIIPILVSLNLSVEKAASMTVIVGTCAIIGRVGGGALMDRFDARIIGSAVTILPAVTAIILIMSDGSIPAIVIAVLIFGISIGAEMDVIAYITSRMFGVRTLGTVFGIINSLLMIGTGLGPVLGNWSYDVTGSYMPMLYAVVPLALAASILILFLGHYRNDSQEESADTGVH